MPDGIQTGDIIDNEGNIANIVDLLGGGTPINSRITNKARYSPGSSKIIGSDGRVYDLVALIQNSYDAKANKVSDATAGNLAGLDADGNLTDSGISASIGSMVTNTQTTNVTQELSPGVSYVFSAGVASITLTFGAALSGCASEYRVAFLAGASAPTVSVPASVVWSPATPIFESGKWYELSFVLLGAVYSGVWTAVEVTP